MTATEIIEFWGKENLTRYTKAVVQGLLIPPSSRSFLIEVGLPSPKDDPIWAYQFEAQKLTRLKGRNSCLCISPKPRPICIDEAQGGRVTMPLIEGDMERFVNSSVEQLCRFLTVSQSHQNALLKAEGDIRQGRLIVTALQEQMRAIDILAIEDENAYWAVVLEGLWYPLMTDEELQDLK